MGVGLARVRGVGERLLRMEAKQRFPLVILHPGPGLSTPQVFGQWDRMGQRGLALSSGPGPIRPWRRGTSPPLPGMTGNALEPPAMSPACRKSGRPGTSCGSWGRWWPRCRAAARRCSAPFADWEKARAAKEALGYRAILTWTYP